MVVVVLAAFVLVALVGLYIGRQRRDSIAPVFRPALQFWRILRLLALAVIAWGLFMSGRAFLQVLALVVALFLGLYIAIEQPLRSVDE